MSLILFIVAIALLILLHEFGHFLAAKASGVQVEEFGIGFPPRVLHLFTWGGTNFTLNAIPLGGFVRPKGENDPSVPGGLSSASPWVRIFVLISGPAMNVLIALLLFAFIFLQIGKPDLNTVEIMDVSANSPAQIAGLEVGDIILKIDDQEIHSTQELHDAIYAHLGETVQLTYQRNGQESRTQLVPRQPPPADGAIGIAMGNPSLPIGPGEALLVGGQAVWEQVTALVQLPATLLSGDANPNEGRLIGYKGMYDIYTEVRAADAAPTNTLPAGINTLSFFASISISLGILNLLPIPALDGGRILFTLPEIILRKRIPPAYENMVNLIGFALLIVLLVYVNIQDFVNPIVLP